MWKTTKFYLVIVSAALNVAFVMTWIAHVVPAHGQSDQGSLSAASRAIWCPLHRQLGVSQAQWQEIEPRLRQFQTAVNELCQKVQTMRSEVIQSIAVEQPDIVAIRAVQDEILATKRKIQDLVVEHLLAEKKILTDNQQDELFRRLRVQSGCSGPPMAGKALPQRITGQMP